MSLILDIIVGASFIIGISTNARRGLVKSLLLVFGYIVSIWLSAYISANYCDEVYGSFLENSIEQKLTKQTMKIDSAEIIRDKVFIREFGVEVTVEEVRRTVLEDGDLAENLATLAASKKSGLDKKLVKKFISKDKLFKNSDAGIVEIAMSNEDFVSAVRILADEDDGHRAEVFYREIGRDYAVTATKWVMTLLLYAVISALISLLVSNINFIDKIPVARFLNTILGGVVGAVEGFVIVMIVALGIRVAAALLGFNDHAVYDTAFFKIFYDIFK